MASSTISRSGTAAFRTLLRSAKAAFKEDKFAYSQARVQLKAEFARNRDEADPAFLEGLFKGVDEVRIQHRMLPHHVLYCVVV